MFPLPPFLAPRWDWIQVEVTSRCNAACIYCPRTLLGDRWRSRDLDWDLFLRLVPELRRTRRVHLQGWGEPLLHPRFFDMLERVKAAGCLAGATSNGLLIDAAVARRLVASNLDVLAVSLAGTDAEHERIRRGTTLAAALSALADVDRARRDAGAAGPSLHVAYMLFRSGLPGLARLPELLAGRGVAHVVVSTLDYLCDERLAHEVLRPEDQAEAEAALQDLARALAARGQSLTWRIPRPGPARTACTENVGRAVVLGVDGGVHPCVITSLPVERGLPPVPGLLPLPAGLCFGSLAEASLSGIWKSPAYKAFRRSFAAADPAPACRDCSKRRVG